MLIVEDDKDLVNAIRSLVEGHGYKVHYATSVPMAIACLDKNKINIIFLDVRLPGEDAFDLIKTMEEKHQKAKVCAITGKDYDDKDIAFFKSRKIPFVTKGKFNADAIIESIRAGRLVLESRKEEEDPLTLKIELQNIKTDLSKAKSTIAELDKVKLFLESQLNKKNRYINRDFILPIATLFGGFGLVFIGMAQKILFYPIMGAIAISLGILHLSGRRN